VKLNRILQFFETNQLFRVQTTFLFFENLYKMRIINCLYAILLFNSCLSFGCKDKTATQTEKVYESPNLKENSYNIGILVVNGVYNTEFTAPYDIFQHTKFRENIRAMNVFTVAERKEIIQTFEGIRFLPDFDFGNVPNIDILVVPSAEHHLDSDLENKILIDFVRKTGQKTMFNMSLCDGAFVLAQAGLLDSVQCTTFPDDVEKMREKFPKLQILEDVSFVHDGRCITSMGGARSFEAALYLCERLYGKKIAQKLAHGLVINWDLEDVPNISPDFDESEK
jgi:transcriptional regulator GlxA family with amidase domain